MNTKRIKRNDINRTALAAWDKGPGLDKGRVRFYRTTLPTGKTTLTARQELENGDYVFAYIWENGTWTRNPG